MISKFIEEVLLESALDNRIDDGIIDLTNSQHLDVIHEMFLSKGLDESTVDALFETILTNEGKHPERQAYNKDGWLVTFPSKEYRDAAIKKGTHSVSDPTHGKGGMNLYYKKKGKQKRQTQQAVTSVQTTQQKASVPPVAQAQSQSVQANQQQASTASTQPVKKVKKILPPDEEGEPLTDKEIEKLKQSAIQKYQGTPTAAPATPTAAEQPAAPSQVPAIDVPVVTEPSVNYSSISKQFAAKKGWKAQPYGEYRDSQGNTVAVIGLSGEVVPIKNTDREEYKLFFEKTKI